MGWSPGGADKMFWILKRNPCAPLCWAQRQNAEHSDCGVSLLRVGTMGLWPEAHLLSCRKGLHCLIQTCLPSDLCFIVFYTCKTVIDRVKINEFVFLFCLCRIVTKPIFLYQFLFPVFFSLEYREIKVINCSPGWLVTCWAMRWTAIIFRPRQWCVYVCVSVLSVCTDTCPPTFMVSFSCHPHPNETGCLLKLRW